MNKQEKEIATIRERDFKIELSDADVQRLWEKAGSVGLTVSELLKNFIGDLVDGTYSNGSDERDLADQWFDRCCFGAFPDKTFLRYLIEWDNLKHVIDLCDYIKSFDEELEYSNAHEDEFTQEDIESIKEDLDDCQNELNAYFSEFKNWAKEKAVGTLREELDKVVKWYEEMKSMKEQQSSQVVQPGTTT